MDENLELAQSEVYLNDYLDVKTLQFVIGLCEEVPNVRNLANRLSGYVTQLSSENTEPQPLLSGNGMGVPRTTSRLLNPYEKYNSSTTFLSGSPHTLRSKDAELSKIEECHSLAEKILPALTELKECLTRFLQTSGSPSTCENKNPPTNLEENLNIMEELTGKMWVSVTPFLANMHQILVELQKCNNKNNIQRVIDNMERFNASTKESTTLQLTEDSEKRPNSTDAVSPRDLKDTKRRHQDNNKKENEGTEKICRPVLHEKQQKIPQKLPPIRGTMTTEKPKIVSERENKVQAKKRYNKQRISSKPQKEKEISESESYGSRRKPTVWDPLLQYKL